MVAAGLGVTTMPRLSVGQYGIPGIQATELESFRRRVHVVTYGEPPDLPATTAFVEAIVKASEDLRLRWR
jgi:DNA-binding transcriptional LysR family regulator